MKKKLNDLKQAADEALAHITMTEAQKQAVRGRIARGSRRTFRRRSYYLGSAVAALLVLVSVLALFRPALGGPEEPVHKGTATSLAAYTVSAEQQRGAFITPESGFLVHTEDTSMTVERLQSIVSITPEVDYDVTQKKDGAFYLKPADPLAENTVYSIGIRDESGKPVSWAFQVESPLTVVSSTPADNTWGMPTSTGIQFCFSQVVSSIDPAQLEITPAVSGHFEYSGKTAAFVPDTALASDTIYHVTLKKGVKSDAGKVLEEDYTFSFRTPLPDGNTASTPRLTNVGSFTETYLTSDPVIIALSPTGIPEGEKMSVRVYTLSSEKEYLSYAKEKNSAVLRSIGMSYDYEADVSSLTPTATFSTSLVSALYGYPYYALLPENPGEGYYLIDIRPENEKYRGAFAQKLVQISDISVYSSSLNGTAAYWINSASTGQPIDNAKISVKTDKKTFTARTDENGMATLAATYDERPVAELTVGAEGGVYADLISLTEDAVPAAMDDYLAFLHTDREAYLPTDSVRVFGMLSPRTAGVSLPETASLVFDGGDPITVSLDQDGSFDCIIPLQNHRSGYAPLMLQIGDAALASHGVQVMEYVKPAYTFDVSTDKAYYRSGDTIELSLAGTFFDGTPAQGVGYSVTSNDYETMGAFDKNGEAAITITPQQRYTSWTPVSYWISVYASGAEDASNISAYTAPLYFPTDYMLTSENLSDENGLRFSLRANRIDYTDFDPDSDWRADDYAAIRGENAVLSGTAEIFRCEYIKTQVGTYYDFILNETVPTYTYEYQETSIDSVNFSTADGTYLSPVFDYPPAENVSYRARLSYVTPDGASLSEWIYLTNTAYPSSSAQKMYYFASAADGAYSAKLGQTRVFHLRNETGTDVTTGSVCYTLSQNQILSSDVVPAGTIDIVMNEALVPTFSISGAYFDGRHVYPISPTTYGYDYSERALTVDITPDADSYRPGGTATFDVRVTDPDGAPVEATLFTTLVDEAAFAVSPQDVDAAASIYASRWYSYPATYASYVQHSTTGGSGAEGGGDGVAEAVRREFVDTAYSQRLKTGPDGRASLRVKLPDNITSWRLTAIAATSGPMPYAGDAAETVSATLNFFANIVMNEKFAAGDDVAMNLRAAGTAEGLASQRVKYDVTLKGGGKTLTKSAEGGAFDYTCVNFGKLAEGRYTATIRAKCGALSDAVERQIEVLPSLHEIPITSYFSLKEGVAIDSMRYPVTLLFHDAENALYFKALNTLRAASSKRSEAALARSAAYDVAKRIFDDEQSALYKPEEGLDLISQAYDGGVSTFSYGSPTADATAKVLVAGGDYIDSARAKDYLYSVLYNAQSAPSEVSAAYLGLAALREPVLSDIQLLLAEKDSAFTLSDRLNLANALALLGDFTTARSFYRTEIAPKATAQSPWLFISDSSADTTELTAKAALLAFLSGEDDFSSLMSYLLDGASSAYYLPLAEISAYLLRAEPPAASDASFSYVKDGKTQSVRFDASPVVMLEMDRDALNAANFQLTGGDVGVTALWVGGPEDLKLTTSPGITVTKSYSGSMTLGSSVKVTLKVSFSGETPKDLYTLSDVIPSGMRFIRADYQNNQGSWDLVYNEGQRAEFCLRRTTYGSAQSEIVNNDFEIVYYVRPALAGTFVSEAPVLRHTRSALGAAGAKTSVTIAG